MTKKLELVKNLVSKNKWTIKCPYPMVAKGIVVHNTANTASAASEIAYMISNNNQVSYHYAIDEKQVVQGIEENRNSWNAGDGVNGNGNRNYLAIEICHSMDYKTDLYAQSEDNAAYFIATLLKKKNWTTKVVKRHYDFSGKDCPHRMLLWNNGKMVDDSKWVAFIDKIQTYLNELNKVEEVAKSYDWKVQTGAYTTKEEALKDAAELKAKGIETYVYKK